MVNLIEKYPEVFGPGTPFDQAGGFQCSPGYRDLIDRLMSDLRNIDHGLEGVIITRIADSAFGGIEVIGGGLSQKQQQAVKNAEDESLRLCEECGAQGNLVDFGSTFVQVLCEDHSKAIPMTVLQLDVPQAVYQRVSRAANITEMSIQEFVIRTLLEHAFVSQVLAANKRK